MTAAITAVDTQVPPHAATGPGSRRTLVAALAVVLLVVGLALIWAGAAQKAAGGYFTTSSARLSTPTSALVTAEIDVDGRRPADPSFDVGDISRVRIRATG